MNKPTVCVTGCDERQKYLAQCLQEQGITVVRQAEFDPGQLAGIDYLIGPVTLYRGGAISPEIKEACDKAGVKAVNYMNCEDFLLLNADLTAEGLLAIIIQNTDFSLINAHILILGQGRCGTAIHKLLSHFSSQIDIYDTVPAFFSGTPYHIVINTIPAPVIRKEHLIQLGPDCIFFEIASPPGGFDQTAIKELGLTLITCPGIPGRYCPRSAANAIARAVLPELQALPPKTQDAAAK
jgi:dipicolinate synthase subunit A